MSYHWLLVLSVIWYLLFYCPCPPILTSLHSSVLFGTQSTWLPLDWNATLNLPTYQNFGRPSHNSRKWLVVQILRASTTSAEIEVKASPTESLLSPILHPLENWDYARGTCGLCYWYNILYILMRRAQSMTKESFDRDVQVSRLQNKSIISPKESNT
jgi:hypothetical protein